MPDQDTRQKRNIILRIFIGFVWLIFIFFLSNFLIGGIVGAIAGASTSNYASGYSAGHTASVQFFQRYGILIFISQITFTAILSFFGILPGTGKYKREMRT